MVGLGRVEVGTDAVAAGEFDRGEESPIEDVAFLDLGGVKEDREGDGIENSNDSRV